MCVCGGGVHVGENTLGIILHDRFAAGRQQGKEGVSVCVSSQEG